MTTEYQCFSSVLNLQQAVSMTITNMSLKALCISARLCEVECTWLGNRLHIQNVANKLASRTGV